MTIRKKDIAKRISAKSDIIQTEALRYIDIALEEMKVALEEGEPVKIRNFGTWETRDKSGRPGRAVRTGEDVWIDPRRVVRFVPSINLKKKL